MNGATTEPCVNTISAPINTIVIIKLFYKIILKKIIYKFIKEYVIFY